MAWYDVPSHMDNSQRQPSKLVRNLISLLEDGTLIVML